LEETEAVYEAVLSAVRHGQPACLLTLVRASGSTPRAPGTKMLLRVDGSTIGTIGGGAQEAAALADARAALATGASRLAHYSMRGLDPGELGVCGGDVDVFLEVLKPNPTLLIAGAGHVAQPLAEMGHHLGFTTTVVDDRPELLSTERFPHADELVLTQFDELSQKVSIGPTTWVVIVTRGHMHDETALRQVLEANPAYVGMIGSRHKVQSVFKRLRDEGVTQARLASVHAPIGLDLGGQTPAEIALSIVAEIVKVRNGGTGRPLSERRLADATQ